MLPESVVHVMIKNQSHVVLNRQPSLPEEDYPADKESTPEPDSEPLPEYSLIHVQKTAIPRASLDQSAPAGWTLNVDADGVWVFTSQQTPEQVTSASAIIIKTSTRGHRHSGSIHD